ncbi:putative tRNA (cytidine(32)/guanosine(34)-2'-O)-methyltransferase [Hypsibius exemplaris]|uniref:tRNA (Cytidine(32)/guanosine(34)-2'-O)-methyltransferase n=1 Tax=Hypsibius exemplaris TaxID=2072580 RepID=A0A1W0WY12_HYPEX|nr:putative tRNA (cytidine(32)/guanosine(34)-2'-O)-methyltransferase [Hypsibius exemplaris]
MSPLDGVIQLQGDITEPETARKIISLFDGEKADLVVSDGAPDVIGLLDSDEYVQHQLVLAALEITTRILKFNGTMVAKVFRGKRIADLCAKLAFFFGSVTVAKPKCSRDSSLEAFVVCQHFRIPSGFSHAGPLSDFLTAQVPPGLPHSWHSSRAAAPFVVCGGEDAFDSDRNYPLNLTTSSSGDYQHRSPVQPPIHPPYEQAKKMRSERTLATKTATANKDTIFP